MDYEGLQRELHRAAELWCVEDFPEESFSSFEETAKQWFSTLTPLTNRKRPTRPSDRTSWKPSRIDDPYGAYITRTEINGNADGPIDGMNVAIKDNIAVAGVPLTCGANFISVSPDTDATVVDRVLAAGGNIVGKTTLSEFAIGGTLETMRIRLPHNPHDAGRYPGGSSAGSAIAVSRGSADAALGTDTAASIRCPAAYSGVVGIRPTSTLVPHHGVVGFAPTFDSIGVLSETLLPGAKLLDAVADRSPRNSSSSDRGVSSYREAVHDGEPAALSSLKVGIPAFTSADTVVSERFDQVIETLREAGTTVTDVQIPHVERAFPVWLGIAASEFTRLFRTGGAQPICPVIEQALADVSSLTRDVREFLVCSEMLEQSEFPFETLARRVQRQIRQSVSQVLTDVDVLATPTMPQVAPRWRALDAGSTKQDSGANTIPFSVADVPAVSLPVAEHAELPIGLQIVGGHLEEASLLRSASAIEECLL